MMTRRFLACDLGALLLPVVSTFSPGDCVPAPVPLQQVSAVEQHVVPLQQIFVVEQHVVPLQ